MCTDSIRILFLKISLKKNRITKKCKTGFENDLWKLFNNSIFGKTLMNVRIHQMVTKFVTNIRQFQKLASNPLLKECYALSPTQLIVNMFRENIELSLPLYIRWAVLELSKTYMFNLYYNTLKKEYNESMSLLYMDTDSFLLKFEGFDIFEKISSPPLKNILDTSNFTPSHTCFSLNNKGKLGYLKSETSNYPIKEVIVLQPKCYSILVEGGDVKKTAKGIVRNEQ